MYWNRGRKDELQYLFLMRYKRDGVEGDFGGGGQGDQEWQGKMRAIKNSVQMVQEVV